MSSPTAESTTPWQRCWRTLCDRSARTIRSSTAPRPKSKPQSWMHSTSTPNNDRPSSSEACARPEAAQSHRCPTPLADRRPTDPELWFPPFPGALEQGDRHDALTDLAEAASEHASALPTLLLIVNQTSQVVVLTSGKSTTYIEPGKSVRLGSERACALIPLRASTLKGGVHRGVHRTLPRPDLGNHGWIGTPGVGCSRLHTAPADEVGRRSPGKRVARPDHAVRVERAERELTTEGEPKASKRYLKEAVVCARQVSMHW